MHNFHERKGCKFLKLWGVANAYDALGFLRSMGTSLVYKLMDIARV